MKDQEVENVKTRITEVAELFERKEIKQRYSFEVLCDFIFDKAKRLYAKYENAIKDLKALQSGDKQSTMHIQRRLEQIEQDYEELKQVLLKNNMLANELTAKFLSLFGEQQSSLVQQALYEKEEGVERFRLIAGKVEVNYVALKQENAHLKERINDYIKQLEFFQQNSDFTNKEKERRKYELREDQARRELEIVKKEKERLVDTSSQMAIALQKANEEVRTLREEADRLREKVTFYEKTFPITLSKHKRSFMVPPLHINSEPTQHNERQATPDTSTNNTAKQRKDNKEYQEII